MSNKKSFDYEGLRKRLNEKQTEDQIRNEMNIKTSETLKRLLFDLSESDNKLYEYPYKKNEKKHFKISKDKKIIIDSEFVEEAEKNGIILNKLELELKVIEDETCIVMRNAKK